METNFYCQEHVPTAINLCVAEPFASVAEPFASSSYEQPSFSVIRFQERRDEILELRRLAYTAAGKLGPGKAKIEETDCRDENAWLVIAEFGGELVASVRLTPPLPGPVDTKAQDLLTQCPELGLESIEANYTEVSWACIHPDRQGLGLFWSLAANMVLAASKLGRRFLIGGTDQSLWSYWQRCGFRDTGVTYRHAHAEHEFRMIVFDTHASLAELDLDSRMMRVLESER